MNRFNVKPEVYFNQGSIEYLKTLKINKALIVTDNMMVQVGFVDKVLEILKSNCNEYKVFSEVKPDPPVEIVAMGVEVMNSFNPDVVIALGGVFHIPHGRTNAILLPYIIKFNVNIESGIENEVGRRYAELSKILGLPSSTIKEGVESLIFAVKVLLRETNTPTTLKEVGINKEEFLAKVETLAKTAMEDRCTVTNPRIVCVNDIIKLYLEAYELSQ